MDGASQPGRDEGARLGRRLDDAGHTRDGALRINPDNAEARNSLGFALQRLGRREEAAAQYAAATGFGRAGAAHNNLGTVRQAEGRLEEAAAHYAEAVRLEPR